MKLSLPTLTPLEKRLAAFLVIGVLGMLLPWIALIPWLPLSIGYFLDLGTHWQLVWGALGLLGSIGLTLSRRKLLPLSVFLVGLSSLWWVTPEALRFAHGPHEALTVVSANLNVNNLDLSRLRKWVDEMDPDVLILQEVSPAAAAELKTWDAFKSHSFVPSEDPFGMAVMVKAAQATIDWTSETGIPFAQVSVPFRNDNVTIYGIHPMPPISAEYHKDRNALIAGISAAAQAHGHPSVLLGDFNASPWSVAMPRHTFFRTAVPFPTWQHILPIDHILATRHFQVIQAGVGPDIGSDHQPTWVRLAKE